MTKAADPSFVDTLAEEQESARRLCDLGSQFDRMPDMLAGQVREAMLDRQWSAAAISRTLTKFGYPVSEGSLRRCRRSCECWRGT